jgi:hypothetical protein
MYKAMLNRDLDGMNKLSWGLGNVIWGVSVDEVSVTFLKTLVGAAGTKTHKDTGNFLSWRGPINTQS